MERLAENVAANAGAYSPSVTVKVEARRTPADVARPLHFHSPKRLLRADHVPQLRSPLLPMLSAAQDLDWGSAEDHARMGKVDILIAADVVFELADPGAKRSGYTHSNCRAHRVVVSSRTL